MTSRSWFGGLFRGIELVRWRSRRGNSRSQHSTRRLVVESLEERTVLAAAVDFAPAQTFASGGDEARFVAVGDFNNDGTPDLVATAYNFDNDGTNTLGVLLGDRFGGFAPAVPLAGIGVPWSVAVSDFDKDGNTDLAVTGGNTVNVLLGDGLGGFAAPLAFASGGQQPVSLAAADFNNDEHADLAVVNRNTLIEGVVQPAVSVLLGDGTGGFSAPASFATRTEFYHNFDAPDSNSVAAGDFNGDNNADLAVTNYDPDLGLYGTVGVLLGDGMGGFAPVVVFDSGGIIPMSVTVGDFNSDGHSDLAVANQHDLGGVGSNVGLLLGNGLGGFATVVTFDSGGSFARSIVIGDFNSDGQADLAVAHAIGNVGVLLGDGLGGFAAAMNFDTGGSTPFAVAAVDFNNDGRTDLAVANLTNATVGVLLNTTNQPPANTVPGAQVVAEDVSKVIAGLSVADDNAASVLTVTLTVGHGTLTVDGSVTGGLAPAGLTGNETSSLTLTGTQAQINATLAAGVTYLGAVDFSGLDILTMATTDSGGLSDTTAVAIEVHSAEQQMAALTAIIAGLEDQQIIRRGDEILLTSMLNLLSTRVGSYAALAFRLRVHVLVTVGTLTLEQGNQLIESMQSIRNSLQ